jgi:hypothetical protein
VCCAWDGVVGLNYIVADLDFWLQEELETLDRAIWLILEFTVAL